MGKVLEFKRKDEFDARLERIKVSLERINKMMQDIREADNVQDKNRRD